jgi:hypothetical protein
MNNIKRLTDFLVRNESLLQIFIFVLFLAVSIPGVQWGTPNLWNPDEMVWRADNALGGELIFDETEPDYNYPSLPKYVMYGIGKVVYGMGYTRTEFIIAARIFSALLGAISGILIYQLAKVVGADAMTAFLAGLLYIASGVAAANGRFAHNDLYLQTFAILCVYFGIKYQYTKARLWIYACFLAVGLAASSKFTGGSLLLVPLFILVLMNWDEIRKDWLGAFEKLLIGGVLCFGGYVIGTPKALLWMAFYFKRVIPALQNYPVYGKNFGGTIGLVGQWAVFKEAVGTFCYLLFIASIIWFVGRLVLRRLGKIAMDEKQAQGIAILSVTLLIFDLPFLMSVNYIPRYFIPFAPFLAVLGALFIKDLLELSKAKDWKFAPPVVTAALAIGIVYSILRLISIALLFSNDARMAAGKYMETLQNKTKTVEYTLYPPNINRDKFAAARNYPIYFVKYPTDVVPTGGKVIYNQGEQGLLDRNVDYLVIDEYTYWRFYNDAICASNPVECDFFKRLMAGETTTFRLVKDFSYSLPPYLPAVSISAVNPRVQIYERVR